MSTLKTGKVKTTTIADELDTESTAVTNVINGSAKAWVNFDGTGTVAIRRSFNVSSLVDDATANYTINFTTAMSDANYCPTGMAGTSATNPSSPNLAAFPVDASSCKCELYNTNNQNLDYAGVFLAILS